MKTTITALLLYLISFGLVIGIVYVVAKLLGRLFGSLDFP